LLAGLFIYVERFGSSLPIQDDWVMVPVWTGNQSVTLAWLWEPHNQHHMPLPKLLLAALGTISNGDARVGMYVNCMLLGVAAAVLILAASRLQGRTHFTDAVIPLAIMHVGQYHGLLVSFSMNLILSALLGTLALAVILRIRTTPTPVQVVALWIVLLLLPLCGNSGLLLVPALLAWLLYAGLRCLRDPERRVRRLGILLLVLGTTAVLELGLYLWSAGVPEAEGADPGLAARLEAAGRMLALCLGPLGEESWPASVMVLLAAVAGMLVLLVSVWLSRPDECLRTVGLLAYLAALATLIMAAGWARAGTGGVLVRLGATRFVSLTAPLICCMYLVCLLYWKRAMLMVLLICMAPVFVINTNRGWRTGAEHRRFMSAVEQDLRIGMALPEAAQKWHAIIQDLRAPPERLAELLEMMRRARQGPFKDLPDARTK
jgi:hypothetical protein